MVFREFAPWNHFSHFEINFAPWFWGVRKWLPLDRGIRTLKWGVRNFRTLKSGVRNFRTLFRTVRKVAWGVRKWHSCARRGFRTVRKFSHLAQWCAKMVFREFAPWNHFSHLEQNFAPWFWGVQNFRTLELGVRNFRTLKSGALFPWFYSPVLLLKSSPHLSWFFLQFIIKIDLN